jgi:hypothetical protein
MAVWLGASRTKPTRLLLVRPSGHPLVRLRRARYAPMTSVDEVFNSEGSFRLEAIDQRALPEPLVGDKRGRTYAEPGNS